VLVIIADAAQDGMSGEYRSITEAFILVGTIIGWNTLIDWLTFRVGWLQKVLEPPPLLLKAFMEPDGQVTVLRKKL
jgi:uncharacterized membrane protein YcaP (DUF421 family)